MRSMDAAQQPPVQAGEENKKIMHKMGRGGPIGIAHYRSLVGTISLAVE